MNDQIISRIATLEQRMAEMEAKPLTYAVTGLEPEPWLVEATRARAFAGGTLELGTVRITGPIDVRTLHDVQDQLSVAWNARALVVEIDSPGGDVGASVDIYRAIRLAPAVAKTAHMGRQCASGALLVALACDHRIARPDTAILLHLARSEPGDQELTAADHQRAAHALGTIDRQMLSIFHERTGASFTALAREAATEAETSIADALRLGLIHEVRV